jgi:uncharacterized protein (TIGR03067 family)
MIALGVTSHLSLSMEPLMRMTVFASLAIAFVAAGASFDDPKKDAKSDAEKIVGKWTAKVGPNADTPITVEFKVKDQKETGEVLVTVEAGDGNEIMITGRYKLDEKAKPKTIDLVDFKSPDGEKSEDNLGIYELNDDELKICTGGAGAERPTVFADMDNVGGKGTILLKRLKEKKDE